MSTQVLLPCRLCGNYNEMNKDIFEDNSSPNNINLKEKILIVTGLIIVQNDIITTKICIDCKDTVKKMYDFRKRAYDTNLKLLSAIRLISQNSSNPTSVRKYILNKTDKPNKIHDDNLQKNEQNLQQNHIIKNKYLDLDINRTEKDLSAKNEYYVSPVINNQSEDNDFSDELEWDVKFPLDDISGFQVPSHKISESENRPTRPLIERIEAKYGITVDSELSDFHYDACHVPLERIRFDIVSDQKFSPVITNRRNRILKRGIDDDILLLNAYCVPLRLKSLSVIPAVRYTRDNINVMFSNKNTRHCMMNVVKKSNANISYKVSRKITTPCVQNLLHYVCHICNRSFQYYLFLSHHISTYHGEKIKNDLLQLKIPRLELDRNYDKSNDINNRKKQMNSVLVPISLHQTQHKIDLNSLPILAFNQVNQVRNEIVNSIGEFSKFKQRNSDLYKNQYPSIIKSIGNPELTSSNNSSYDSEKNNRQSCRNESIKNKLINPIQDKSTKFDHYNANIKNVLIIGDSPQNNLNIDKYGHNQLHEDHCYCALPKNKKSEKSCQINIPKKHTLKVLSPSKINSIIENKQKQLSSATN